MKLLIRADADATIGAGHVMRTLALAQAVQDDGGSVVFASARMPLALGERITGEGMRVIPSEDVIAAAREQEADWVVIDGYQFDAAYQDAVKAAGFNVLWIDDDAHAAHYSADLVLNQNLHADAAMYANRPDLLLGPRYALLRREFRSWRDRRREPADVVRRVLVTFGGSDPHNLTAAVLQALEGMPVEPVVAKGRNDMAELMASCDAAISAAGSTCWELAFFGLPALVVSIADNQRNVAARLAAAGAVVDLGWYRDVFRGDWVNGLTRLRNDAALRGSMSQAGRALVDGDGALRVLDRMRARGFELREATDADGRLLWDWVNDPDVRAQSFSSEPIPWDAHVRWLREKLDSPDCRIFIASEGAVPVGQIRFDFERGEAVVTVSIDAAARGRGWGARMIREGVDRVFAESRAAVIHAYVKPENAGSLQAFANAGFAAAGTAEVRGLPATHLVLRRNG